MNRKKGKRKGIRQSICVAHTAAVRWYSAVRMESTVITKTEPCFMYARGIRNVMPMFGCIREQKADGESGRPQSPVAEEGGTSVF